MKISYKSKGIILEKLETKENLIRVSLTPTPSTNVKIYHKQAVEYQQSSKA